MNRYLKLYLVFLRNSFARQGQYSFNLLVDAIISVVWGLVYILMYKFIFGNIKQVGDWNYDQVLILAATFLVFNSIFKAIFGLNFQKFAYTIYYGDLDIILTKPLSSQFYISLKEFSFHTFLKLVMGFLVFLVVIKSTGENISLISFILFSLMIILGIILVYALWFLTLNLIFLVGNIENIYELFHPFLRFTIIPLDVLPKAISGFFFFVFPLVFVTTVPVKILLGLISWPTIVWGVFATGFFLFLSHKVWQHNLKSYSSASS